MMENMFRFMTIRQPKRLKIDDFEKKVVYTYSSDEKSNFYLELSLLKNSENAREKMIQHARDFINGRDNNSLNFVSHLHQLSIPLSDFDQWLLKRRSPIQKNDLLLALEQIFNTALSDLVKSENYNNDRIRIGDSLVASAIYFKGVTQAKPKLVRAIRLLGLLERIAENDTVFDERNGIEKALRATVLLPSDLFPLPKDKTAEKRRLMKIQKLKEEREKENKKLIDHLNQIQLVKNAMNEIENLFKSDLIYRKKNRKKVKNPSVLSNFSIKRLTKNTKKVLNEVGVPNDFIDIPVTITTLEKEISKLAHKHIWFNRSDYNSLLEGLSESETGLDSDSPPLEVPFTVGSVRPLGITDLMIVKQDLIKYEPGEIAHIENVMGKETRERKHRRAKTTEETILVANDRMEETERDLESAERFELQRETEKVINEDMRAEAGVTVTYDGPMVDVTASADFAYEHSEEDSNRTATSFGRDVTERAVHRIHERVHEERTRRIMEELEEINTHAFENKDPEHIIGIYRWLDKIYKIQTFNYGKRLMMEFIIPEPAAFLRHIKNIQPKKGSSQEEPKPPQITQLINGPVHVPLISPAQIDDWNYLELAGQYNIELDPPPPYSVIVGASYSEDKLSEGSTQGSFQNINVPKGYNALTAYLVGSSIVAFENEEVAIKKVAVNIGRHRVEVPEDTAIEVQLNNEDSIVPVSMKPIRFGSYSINVEVVCIRSSEKIEKWQIETFERTMMAYNEQLAQYEEELRAEEIVRGVAIRGENPAKNREIEETELKKGCISILTAQYFDDFDAVRDESAEGYPEMDFEAAKQEGEYTQFFEQCFEWRNMTYLFYPYFWGRKSEWPSILREQNIDPLFEKFLRAGSARVQVPIRRNYENALINFLLVNPGEIWGGGDAPVICNPEDHDCLYVSILDEIKEQHDAVFVQGEGTISVENGSSIVTGIDTQFTEEDIDKEIIIQGEGYRIANIISATELTLSENYRGSTINNLRYALGFKYVGEPWEVKIPTSLVILQEDATLPNWTTNSQ